MASSLESVKSKSSEKGEKSNSEEYDNAKVERELFNWNIPRVPVEKVYKKSVFKFKSSSSIKTGEQTESLSTENASFNLFDRNVLLKYRPKYHFLHIGMVQVAVKPLTRQGLNSDIILCLRDCRLIKFQDSLLAMIESSLCNGPIYFNCFPNLTVSLMDKWIHHTLTLNFKTSGNDMLQGAVPLTITYRVYYKVMTSPMKANALLQSSMGKTLFFQVDLQKQKEVVPKSTHWNDVQVPPNWISVQKERPPEVKNEGPQFIKHPDGSVLVKF